MASQTNPYHDTVGASASGTLGRLSEARGSARYLTTSLLWFESSPRTVTYWAYLDIVEYNLMTHKSFNRFKDFGVS